MRRTDRGEERRDELEESQSGEGEDESGRGIRGEHMKKRMKQMLEADVHIQGGRAARNNAGIEGTLDGPKKKKIL